MPPSGEAVPGPDPETGEGCRSDDVHARQARETEAPFTVTSSGEITQLWVALREGEQAAADRLFPLVAEELKS